jgi:hypothetical protein
MVETPCDKRDAPMETTALRFGKSSQRNGFIPFPCAMGKPEGLSHYSLGGATGIRTPDPLLAKQVL